MKTYFSTATEPQLSHCAVVVGDKPPKINFGNDELNALRYVAGYVPLVLLKKSERMRELCKSIFGSGWR